MVIHADIVSVKFRDDALVWHAQYEGQIDEGNPADWAVRLREALKPCWKPSKATVPWRVGKENRNDKGVHDETGP